MNNQDFVQEVNEDIQQEKLLRFWKKYSNYVYGAVVAILVFVAGTTVVKNYYRNQKMEFYDRYIEAINLLMSNRIEDGLTALRSIQDSGNKNTIGYAVMAKFQEAAYLLRRQKEGEKPSVEAIKIYWELANDLVYPKSYRDIATYLSGFHALGNTYEELPKAELLIKLQEMTDENNTFRLMALELLAHYKKLEGNSDDARKYCETVISDSSLINTSTIGERCRALLMTLPEKNKVEKNGL